MEHGGDADSGAESLGIGGDDERGLCRGLHEQVVDHAFVLIGHVAQLGRQRVDDMEIADGQQLGLARSQPLAGRRSLTLRAMPIATAVVADNRVTAFVVLALRDVAAERRSPAALDRAHHLQLVEAHMSCVGQAPSGTVVAEDVRDLQSWTGHETGVTSPAARPCLVSWPSCARSTGRAGSRRMRSDLWPRERSAPSFPTSNVRATPGSF